MASVRATSKLSRDSERQSAGLRRLEEVKTVSANVLMSKKNKDIMMRSIKILGKVLDKDFEKSLCTAEDNHFAVTYL